MSDGRPQALVGWGRTSSSCASLATAGSAGDVARLVRSAGPAGILARGLGRSYGDAAQNAGGVVVGRVAPRAAIELDSRARSVRVSAGTSLGRALRELLPAGWRLPVLPGTRYVTVAGAIAADVHGKNHHTEGSFGRYVRELTLVDGLGEQRTVSRTDDPEAFWATVGGMGLTGIVTSAVLDVVPAPSARLCVRTRRMTDLETLVDTMSRSGTTYAVAWLDGSRGRGFGRGVLDEAEHEAEGQDDYRPPRGLTVPNLPVSPLRPGVVRAFNDLRWRRAPVDEEHTVDFPQFFHPLDAIGSWPALYGRHGLLQWQFVVPDTARDFVARSLRRLVDAGLPPYLTVLKRMGPRSGAPLSFPSPGWTLAVDLPAGSSEVRRVLDELDEELVATGGRVYLVKDARLAARHLPTMYPQLAEWQQTRRRLDPGGRFVSDLARRLALA